MAFDFRLVRITFEDNGITDVFENLAISAIGQTTASWRQNQSTITVFNVDDDTRNRISTKYTPINQLYNKGNFGTVTLEVGRESYGLFRLFVGNVSTINVTNPPDIGLIFNVIANYFAKTNIQSRSYGETAKLSSIAENIAENLGLSLEFNATDRTVTNPYFEGSSEEQLRILTTMGYIQAFVDGETLVVLDEDKSRGGEFTVSSESGMIGIPQWNESGINVRILVNPSIRVGQNIRIISIINPSVNQYTFKVVNILFSISSRDTPFYYDLFCVPLLN